MTEDIKPIVPMHAILALGAELTALTLDELRGTGRERRLIRARMAIAHYARREGYSLLHIGRVMRRDHTSIRNQLQKAEVWRGRDPLFDRIMANMEAALARYVAPPVVTLAPRPMRAILNDQDEYELVEVEPRHIAPDPMALALAAYERQAA